MPVYRIRQIEREYSDMHSVIPKLVNVHGQAQAAQLLGISQTTVSKWLKDNGYVRVIRFERLNDQPKGAA